MWPQMIPAVAIGVLLAAAVWRFMRRQARREGPLADVPDAPATATPMEAPGMTLPYSSLDPFAAPKPTASQASVEGERGSA